MALAIQQQAEQRSISPSRRTSNEDEGGSGGGLAHHLAFVKGRVATRIVDRRVILDAGKVVLVVWGESRVCSMKRVGSKKGKSDASWCRTSQLGRDL